MMRLSLYRLTFFSCVVATAWLAGCVKDDPATSAAGVCDQYCDEVQAKCNNQNFTDRNQCMAVCALMKPGVEGAPPDDTVACRLANAKAATKDDPAGCRKASAFGGGACGEPCVTFCNMVNVICIDGRDPTLQPYPDVGSCLEACQDTKGATPIVYDPNASEGPAAGQGGNTLNCRMYHSMLAIPAAAKTTHCPHTKPVSAACHN
jgi:hypothetical protein